MAIRVVLLIAAILVSTAPDSSASAKDQALPPACPATPALTEPAEGDPQPIDPSAAGWFLVDGADDWDTLLVGRFDGRVFAALQVDGDLKASGPVDGQVLAWWREGRGSALGVADTGTGQLRRLRHTADPVSGAAFGPAGDIYYVTVDPSSMKNRIWREDVATGARALVGRGPRGWTRVVASVDRQSIALEARVGREPEVTRAVVDVCRGAIERRRDPGSIEMVGMFGRDLIAYVDAPMGALIYPLVAVHPDGSGDRFADWMGTAATVVPDGDEQPVLVLERWTEPAHGAWVVLRSWDDPGTVIHETDGQEWGDGVQMVWRSPWVGAETPGYIAILPDGLPYLSDLLAFASAADLPRLLVPLDGGPPIDLGRQQRVVESLAPTIGPMPSPLVR